MIKQAVHDFLMGDAGLHAAVGGRVYDGRVPQHGSYPCLVLTEIASDHYYHMQNEADTQATMVQVDCYDRDPGQAHKTVAELVRSRLSGYYGDLGAGVRCESATVQRRNQLDEEPEDGSDNWVRRISFDFRIFHNAAVPTH